MHGRWKGHFEKVAFVVVWFGLELKCFLAVVSGVSECLGKFVWLLCQRRVASHVSGPILTSFCHPLVVGMFMLLVLGHAELWSFVGRRCCSAGLD